MEKIPFTPQRKHRTPLVPASDDEDPECGDSGDEEEEDDDTSQLQSATSSARRFKVDWREIQTWCRKTQHDADIILGSLCYRRIQVCMILINIRFYFGALSNICVRVW